MNTDKETDPGTVGRRMAFARYGWIPVSIALFFASWVVVMTGAYDEPYSAFKKSDAFVQIGAAAALSVLWLQLGAWIIACVLRHDLSKRWLAALLAVAMAVYWLVFAANGYVDDIERFAIPRPKTQSGMAPERTVGTAKIDAPTRDVKASVVAQV